MHTPCSHGNKAWIILTERYKKHHIAFLQKTGYGC
ncbi:hypothetical protein GLYMA_17G099900v4 [Glycine max]|uniref:Uncharacterized protein n=1 Tax=Glycine max TaxID=3847 RepID=A0A0R0FJK1_SOYBN|nr:hypothetical protein GLYMA_17G099900v4 [Glycine max]